MKLITTNNLWTMAICALAVLSATIPMSAQDVSSGLQAWYMLDGNGFDETANELHGQLFGQLEVVPGRNAREAGALKFDSDYKACVGLPKVLDWEGPFSVNVFVNGDDFRFTGGAAEETFVILDQQRDLQIAVKRLDVESLMFYAELSSGSGSGVMHRVSDGMFVEDFAGSWRMLTVIYDGANLRLYVGAREVQSIIIPGQPTFTSEMAAIGSSVDRRNGFDGAIDDLRIYDRVLTEADMLALMESDEIGPAISREIFEGRVFTDFNENCLADDTPAFHGGRLIHVMPNDRYYRTDRHGRWNIVLQAGTYTARLEPHSQYHENCAPAGAEREFTIDNDLNLIGSLDFATVPDRSFCELSTSITTGLPRPGFPYVVEAEVINTGLCPWSGWVHIVIDPRATLNSSIPEYDVQFDNIVSFREDDLPMGHRRGYRLELTLSSDAELGTELCSIIRTEIDSKSDEVLRADRDEDCVVIRGAYDPNDIAVNPGPVVAEVDTDLSYRIRFQNTGTYHAERVIVKQQLPKDIKIASMLQGIVSHDYEFFIDQNRMATWVFEDIMLPDSSSDLAGSQGFIKYRIMMQDETQRGTEILSDASIYFDFNDPIVTNTAKVQLAEITTSAESPESLRSQIFPNPANDNVTILTNFSGGASIELVNILGEVEQRFSVEDAARIELDISAVSEGTYFVRVTSGLIQQKFGLQVRR